MSGYGGREAPFEAIHDSLYYRAVVVDDGDTRAAIVVGDVSSIGFDFFHTVTARIEDEIGIPPSHVLMAATHTHGGPRLAYQMEHPGENVEAYTNSVADKVVQVVREAERNLQPARIGVGRGRADVNINRRARLANGNYWLGRNPDGPSDKTVHVVKFETLTGKPVAVLANYSVHAVVLGPDNLQITADLPGTTSSYVRAHYDGAVVAPWTSGAAGDQNPIYATVDGFGGRVRPVEALGQILGEEVVRVADGLETTEKASIRARQEVITVPGKKNPPGPRYRPDGNYEFLDAEPVEIRLTALRIGNIVLCGVSGEVLTLIDRRLERESPFAETIMVTNANGSSGYLPNNAAYDKISYEIVSARVKRGVEDAIIGKLLSMLDQL